MALPPPPDRAVTRRVLTLAVGGLVASVLAVVVTAGPALAAGEPTDVTVASGDASLVVSWTAPTDVTPVAYTVRHRQKGTSTWTTSSAINHPTLTYTLSTLTNGTTYEVQVNTSNPGPSSWVSAEGVAGAPGNLSGLTLMSGNRQLGVSWTAPADNGSAITDYDIRYRDVTASPGWVEFYDGGEVAVSNSTVDTSNGPGGDPVDFGEITGLGLTVTRESVGGNYGVYKLGSAVDKIRFSVRVNFSQAATTQVRYASTKPTASNLATHGTQLWSQSATKINDTWWRANRSGSSPPLAADSYIWVTTAEAETVTSSILRMSIDLASTATSATLTGLANGNEHLVQVRASNDRGEGSWSGSARLKPGLPDAPGSPTVAPGSSQLSVAWTAPASNGLTIRDYDVQYSSDSGATWTEWDASTTSTATSATITGLTNGTTYLVQVRAGNMTGDGPWSPSTTATAGAPSAPAAPTLTSGNTQLAASWSAPVTNGSDITDYDVEYRAEGSSTWTEWNASDTSTTTTATVTSLTNGTTYLVRVRAANGRGDGPWSAATTATAGAPSAPAAPTLTSGNTQIGVSWTAPADSGSSITDYDVRYSSDSGATWTEWNANNTSTATTATITGLTNNTSYQVQVRAANARADGAWSSSATTKAGLPAAPAAPTLIADNTALSVAWTAPAANGSSITDYDVQYSSDSGVTWVEWDASTTSTATAATVTGLTNDTTYQVQVRAVNSVGDGPWSPSASAAPTAQKPAAPTAPTLASGNASLEVSWSAPAANGSSITDYDVQYSSDSGATWVEWDVSTASTATTATVTGLTNNTTYQVQVRAGNAVGDGPWSPSATLKAGLPATPAAPDLTPGNGSLRAVWTAPSGNGSTISGYDVQYSSNGGTTWQSHTHSGTSTSATISTLTNGTSYQVQVRAKSSVGTGPWSSSATATVGAPAPPIAPTITVGNAQLAVAWAAPTANGAAITDYDVRYRADGTTTWTEWQASTTSTTTAATVTGLTNNSTYHVSVRAANSRGASPWSTSTSAAPAAQVPDAPAKPSVFSSFMYWAAPNGNGATITDYDIRYSSDSATTWTEWDPGNTSTTIFFNYLTTGNLPGGRTYVFQVRAENSVGPGAWSPTTDSVTLAARAPEKPAAPDLSSSSMSLTVSWTAPEDNGSAITDYDVRHSTDQSNWNTVEGGTSDATTTTTITGLNNNWTYFVQVRATNSVGDSPWSDSTALKVGVPGTPSAPTLTSGNAQLGVSWTAPDSGGLTISDYDMQYRAVGTTNWISHDHTGTTTTATITTLTNATAYEVQVRAKSSRGTGLWSASSTETPGKPGAPSAPTLTAGHATGVVDTAQLTVSWTAPTTYGLAVSDYDVQYSSDSGTTWTEWNASNTSVATTATITGLAAGTWQVQVRAASSAGDGPWSASSSQAVTTAPAAPDMPTLVSGGASLSVSWTAPANGGSTITGYAVQYRAAGTAIWTSSPHTGTTANASITGLTNGTTYEVQVRAANAIGSGPWSASASGAPGGPSVPVDIWVHPVDRALDVSWLYPANDHGSAVTDYDVRYREVGTTTWIEWDAASTSTGSVQLVTGLTNGTKYEVQARAENAYATGPWSASITADPGAPARPARPSLAASIGQLGVSWNPPSNHGSAITDYDVRYSSDKGATWTQWDASSTSTATTATITGLGMRVLYWVQVRAENARGGGPWSIASPFRTSRPKPPKSVSVTRVGTTLQVSWPRVWQGTTGYHVVFSTDEMNSWTRLHTDYTGTSVTITGADRTLPYVVGVAAFNGYAHSSWTNSSRIPPDPFAVPPPEPGPVTVTRSTGTLTATWTAVTGATGYHVVYSTHNDRNWTRLHTNQAGTSATITGADDGVDYYIGVQAVNAAGVSAWVNSDLVRALLLPPTMVNVTRTAGHLSVSWPAVTGATGYDVVYDINGNQSWSRWATALDATQTTITGADDTATYRVGVRAVTSNAASYWTNSAAVPPP